MCVTDMQYFKLFVKKCDQQTCLISKCFHIIPVHFNIQSRNALACVGQLLGRTAVYYTKGLKKKALMFNLNPRCATGLYWISHKPHTIHLPGQASLFFNQTQLPTTNTHPLLNQVEFQQDSESDRSLQWSPAMVMSKDSTGVLAQGFWGDDNSQTQSSSAGTNIGCSNILSL